MYRMQSWGKETCGSPDFDYIQIPVSSRKSYVWKSSIRGLRTSKNGKGNKCCERYNKSMHVYFNELWFCKAVSV